MKFATLKYQYIYKPHNGANYGDNIQTFAAEMLLKKIGVRAEDIVRVNRDTLAFYYDEHVVLITNGCFYTFPDTNIFPMTDNVVPFYFGLHLTEEWGTRDFIKNNRPSLKKFKKFEPVGCRDIGTADYLRYLGVKTYYSRCLTYTFPKRTNNVEHGKVFLVETPDELNKYIPQEYKDKIEYLTHWPHPLPCSPITEDLVNQYDQEAIDILRRYKEEAILVVTKRFHCAIPCIAMGIPVIVVHENPKNQRMSSLSDILKIYSYEELDKIDWYPTPIDIESIKREIELNFILNLVSFDKKYKLNLLPKIKVRKYKLELLYWKLFNWFKCKNKFSGLCFTLASLFQFYIRYERNVFKCYLFNLFPHLFRVQARIFNFMQIDLAIGKYKNLDN